jgi:hypothetical protein
MNAPDGHFVEVESNFSSFILQSLGIRTKMKLWTARDIISLGPYYLQAGISTFFKRKSGYTLEEVAEEDRIPVNARIMILLQSGELGEENLQEVVQSCLARLPESVIDNPFYLESYSPEDVSDFLSEIALHVADAGDPEDHLNTWQEEVEWQLNRLVQALNSF